MLQRDRDASKCEIYKMKLELWLREVGAADLCCGLHRSVRMRSPQPMETSHSEWITSKLTKLSWQIFYCWLKGGTVQSLPASIRHHLPQEVSGSRWEVMELCGSVGGNMTSCQALMQANIWRLLATSFLSCWRGPLAWSQKPPRGPEPGPRRQ